MADDWNTVQLGEVAVVRSGYAFKSSDWQGSGIPVVKIANVKGGRLEMSGCSFVTEATAAEAVDFQLSSGDILIAMTGYIGDVARVRKTDLPCVLNQRVGKFSVRDKSRLDPDYLYTFLSWVETRRTIESLGYGSAQPNVSPSLIHKIELPLPPLPEQRAIASILGALDDKIDLNRRMCQTLEEMARALFKSWFVDFDPVRAKIEGRDPGLPKEIADLFPSRLVDSELGPIPEGWRVMKLGAMAKIEKGLSYKGAGLTESGGVPMINLGCFGGDGLFRADKLKHYSAEYQPRHLARCGDLLVANTDMTQDRIILGSPMLVPPSLGRADSLFTHHVFALRFMPEWERYSLYCYYALLQPAFRNIAAGFATGTTVLALPRDGMEQFPIATPDDRTTAAFIDLVAPLRARQDATRAESLILDQLRDTLLPKLISGELRVPASLGTMQEVAT